MSDLMYSDEDSDASGAENTGMEPRPTLLSTASGETDRPVSPSSIRSGHEGVAVNTVDGAGAVEIGSAAGALQLGIEGPIATTNFQNGHENVTVTLESDAPHCSTAHNTTVTPSTAASNSKVLPQDALIPVCQSLLAAGIDARLSKLPSLEFLSPRHTLDIQLWYASCSTMAMEALVERGSDDMARIAKASAENKAIAKGKMQSEQQLALQIASEIQRRAHERRINISEQPLPAELLRPLLKVVCPEAVREADSVSLDADEKFVAAVIKTGRKHPSRLPLLIRKFLFMSFRLSVAHHSLPRPAAGSSEVVLLSCADVMEAAKDVPPAANAQVMDVVKHLVRTTGNHSNGVKIGVLREIFMALHDDRPRDHMMMVASPPPSSGTDNTGTPVSPDSIPRTYSRVRKAASHAYLTSPTKSRSSPLMPRQQQQQHQQPGSPASVPSSPSFTSSSVTTSARKISFADDESVSTTHSYRLPAEHIHHDPLHRKASETSNSFASPASVVSLSERIDGGGMPSFSCKAALGNLRTFAMQFTKGLLHKYRILNAVPILPHASNAAAGTPETMIEQKELEARGMLLSAHGGANALDCAIAVFGVVQEALYMLTHSTLQHVYRRAFAAEDEKWHAATAAIANLPPCAFGMSHDYCTVGEPRCVAGEGVEVREGMFVPLFPSSATFSCAAQRAAAVFAPAITLLRAADNCSSPLVYLSLLKDVMTLASDARSHEKATERCLASGLVSPGPSEPIGADELVPCLCFVLNAAAVPFFCSTLALLEDVCPSAQRSGQEGYAMVTFRLAVEHVMQLGAATNASATPSARHSCAETGDEKE